ncbi:unnamed protein product [Strongylus vulgaris]|uniref:G-protein coupled receptors family 1 profile domain-containing protein n=1 Tax=Strongylus vulgaris TaxID=40348 RepID=A0A3P7K9K9_STRVU|nr:unnamed protein product [Strongylus vulgaris]
MEQQTLDFIVAGTWFTLSLYSLAANILLFILVGRSVEMRTFPSYWIIISSTICETSMSMFVLCYAIPSILLHDNLSKIDALTNFWMILSYNFFWYTAVIHFALMAINRFICIVCPAYYPSLFSKRNTACLLGLCYFLGLSLSLPMLLPCCYILWDSYNYITFYVDPETWYRFVDLGLNTTVLTISIVFYAAVLMKIRRLRQQSQFLAVSLVYVLTWTSWQWLPCVSLSKWIYFAMMTFSVFSNAANPTIYLVFNKNLRHKVLDLLFRRNCNSSTVTITVKPSKTTKVSEQI